MGTEGVVEAEGGIRLEGRVVKHENAYEEGQAADAKVVATVGQKSEIRIDKMTHAGFRSNGDLTHSCRGLTRSRGQSTRIAAAVPY